MLWGKLELVSAETLNFDEKKYSPPKCLELRGECVTVGRAVDKDIQIQLLQISNLHCKLCSDHSVTDYSSNGTFVNNVRVNSLKEKEVKRVLNGGDRVAFYVSAALPNLRIEYEFSIVQTDEEEEKPRTIAANYNDRILSLENEVDKFIKDKNQKSEQILCLTRQLAEKERTILDIETKLAISIDSNTALTACLNAYITSKKRLEIEQEQIKNQFQDTETELDQVKAQIKKCHNNIEIEKQKNIALQTKYEEIHTQAMQQESRAKSAEEINVELETRVKQLEKELTERSNQIAAEEKARQLRQESALAELQQKLSTAEYNLLAERLEKDNALLQAQATKLQQDAQNEIRLATVIADAACDIDYWLVRAERSSLARSAADASTSAALASAFEIDLKLSQALEENTRLNKSIDFLQSNEHLLVESVQQLRNCILHFHTQAIQFKNTTVPICDQVLGPELPAISSPQIQDSSHRDRDDNASHFSPQISSHKKRSAQEESFQSKCRRRLDDILEKGGDNNSQLNCTQTEDPKTTQDDAPLISSQQPVDEENRPPLSQKQDTSPLAAISQEAFNVGSQEEIIAIEPAA
mmetsp:Transcript_15163/g.20064  ORF Transcript_15163/g.20064 Transcript_15163/m.20064 type:complete len:583 (+) Transcript_15163:15-1763(+)